MSNRRRLIGLVLAAVGAIPPGIRALADTLPSAPAVCPKRDGPPLPRYCGEPPRMVLLAPSGERQWADLGGFCWFRDGCGSCADGGGPSYPRCPLILEPGDDPEVQIADLGPLRSLSYRIWSYGAAAPESPSGIPAPPGATKTPRPTARGWIDRPQGQVRLPGDLPAGVYAIEVFASAEGGGDTIQGFSIWVAPTAGVLATPSAGGSAASPTPAAAFDPQRDYDQSAASDEIRASFGNIFFGRVEVRVGETTPPAGDIPLSEDRYLVWVDKSLKGLASGTVPIVYSGAYEETPDTLGFGPLRIGERYLFFAGGDRSGTVFYVEAGSGAVLVTDTEQERRLGNKYGRLIPSAEVHERDVIAHSTARAASRRARPVATPPPAPTGDASR